VNRHHELSGVSKFRPLTLIAYASATLDTMNLPWQMASSRSAAFTSELHAGADQTVNLSK